MISEKKSPPPPYTHPSKSQYQYSHLPKLCRPSANTKNSGPATREKKPLVPRVTLLTFCRQLVVYDGRFRYSYDIYVRWDGHMQYLSLLPLLRFSGYFKNGARGRAKPRGPRVSSATKLENWYNKVHAKILKFTHDSQSLNHDISAVL